MRPPGERKVTNDRRVLDTEVQAVIAYRQLHKNVGYRKLTWMTVDEEVACLSESAVYTDIAYIKIAGVFYGNAASPLGFFETALRRWW